MKEHIVNFSTLEVKAVLDSRQNQFRRTLTIQPHPKSDQATLGLDDIWRFSRTTAKGRVSRNSDDIRCPYGQVGDRLYVREAFRYFDASIECGCSEFPCPCPPNGTPLYKATHDMSDGEKWKRAIQMPKSLSRIQLEVVDVRPERLQSISRADAAQQGFIKLSATGRYAIRQGDQYFGLASGNPCEVFQLLWKETHGEKSWKSNPWVWVVKFKVVVGESK